MTTYIVTLWRSGTAEVFNEYVSIPDNETPEAAERIALARHLSLDYEVLHTNEVRWVAEVQS